MAEIPTSAQPSGSLTPKAATTPAKFGTVIPPKPTAITAVGGKPLVAPAPLTPVRAPTFQIETSQERSKYIKLLVYGDFGVGKTYLMGTSAAIESMRDVLLINAESGSLTYEQDENDDPFEFANIDRIRIKDYATLGRVQEFLKVHCRLRDEDNVEKLKEIESKLRGIPVEEITEPRRYYTAIVDSLTEVEAFCMYQLLGITDATKIDDEVASAEWAEYKKQHTMIARLVRSYRDLPMNVLFVCSRSYTQDEAKRFNYGPQMTGKLSGQVQGFVDMVGYLTSGAVASAEGEANEKTIARRLYVQPVGRFAAKCRFSQFKKTYFDNPTMETIFREVGLLPKLAAKTAASTGAVVKKAGTK